MESEDEEEDDDEDEDEDEDAERLRLRRRGKTGNRAAEIVTTDFSARVGSKELKAKVTNADKNMHRRLEKCKAGTKGATTTTAASMCKLNALTSMDAKVSSLT